MSGNGAADRSPEAAAARPPRSGKLLRRSNSDRLRMHAPSSIEVASPASAATGRASEWKLAIPLLSPLDLDLAPWPPADPPPEARAEPEAPPAADARWTKWEHPAAPLYYEPVPSNAAPFVSSHCA